MGSTAAPRQLLATAHEQMAAWHLAPAAAAQVVGVRRPQDLRGVPDAREKILTTKTVCLRVSSAIKGTALHAKPKDDPIPTRSR